MKVDELRVLEVDELGGKLKAARRELYELRFKHAVGQLENSSQISKVRHDMARIMTVLQERAFGIPKDASIECSLQYDEICLFAQETGTAIRRNGANATN